MSDQNDIQNLRSPCQELSNDVSYVGLSKTFKFSTCLRSRVWDYIVLPVYVLSNWYSPSVISKSRASQRYMTCTFILKFYNLYIVKVRFGPFLKHCTQSNFHIFPYFAINSRFHDFSIQGNSRKSLSIWRLRNQRIFDLQKSKIYHEKGLEKC